MEGRNEALGILLGILLLLAAHLIAAIVIFLISVIFGAIYGGYASLMPLIFGIAGFFLWQLIYVIPLIIWLRRRRNMGMMKGIIAGAVVTALINGSCFLLFVVQ